MEIKLRLLTQPYLVAPTMNWERDGFNQKDEEETSNIKLVEGRIWYACKVYDTDIKQNYTIIFRTIDSSIVFFGLQEGEILKERMKIVEPYIGSIPVMKEVFNHCVFKLV